MGKYKIKVETIEKKSEISWNQDRGKESESPQTREMEMSVQVKEVVLEKNVCQQL